MPVMVTLILTWLQESQAEKIIVLQMQSLERQEIAKVIFTDEENEAQRGSYVPSVTPTDKPGLLTLGPFCFPGRRAAPLMKARSRSELWGPCLLGGGPHKATGSLLP